MSAFWANKSTIFPFPSSPHWAPKTTDTVLKSSILARLTGISPFMGMWVAMLRELSRGFQNEFDGHWPSACSDIWRPNSTTKSSSILEGQSQTVELLEARECLKHTLSISKNQLFISRYFRLPWIHEQTTAIAVRKRSEERDTWVENNAQNLTKIFNLGAIYATFCKILNYKSLIDNDRFHWWQRRTYRIWNTHEAF